MIFQKPPKPDKPKKPEKPDRPQKPKRDKEKPGKPTKPDIGREAPNPLKKERASIKKNFINIK